MIGKQEGSPNPAAVCHISSQWSERCLLASGSLPAAHWRVPHKLCLLLKNYSHTSENLQTHPIKSPPSATWIHILASSLFISNSSFYLQIHTFDRSRVVENAATHRELTNTLCSPVTPGWDFDYWLTLPLGWRCDSRQTEPFLSPSWSICTAAEWPVSTDST